MQIQQDTLDNYSLTPAATAVCFVSKEAVIINGCVGPSPMHIADSLMHVELYLVVAWRKAEWVHSQHPPR